MPYTGSDEEICNRFDELRNSSNEFDKAFGERGLKFVCAKDADLENCKLLSKSKPNKLYIKNRHQNDCLHCANVVYTCWMEKMPLKHWHSLPKWACLRAVKEDPPHKYNVQYEDGDEAICHRYAELKNSTDELDKFFGTRAWKLTCAEGVDKENMKKIENCSIDYAKTAAKKCHNDEFFQRTIRKASDTCDEWAFFFACTAQKMASFCLAENITETVAFFIERSIDRYSLPAEVGNKCVNAIYRELHKI
ncbi:unnamed protein product, partial [Mesorhabditis belari]|uniref:Uncharacterized protein n=1 Tax=Mesorhabditis belari TaxID=2138241 RepID=A0AAF3ERP0_9BILA